MTTPGGRLSNIGELGSPLPPSPRAWPSSCVTVVRKLYWPAAMADGSEPAYQFQPWISVISPVSKVKQPRTPLAIPPTGLVVLLSRVMLAREGSLTSDTVTP